MRILFISTFYPPYVVGGWEQLVEDLNQGLRSRGHETFVLTTNHGVPAGREALPPEPGVERSLLLESDLQYYRPSAMLSQQSRVRHNLERTEAVLKHWQPDVVFVHIMWNLTRAIPWLAEQLLPGRVVYYVADHWPYTPDTHVAYWQDAAGSPLRRTFKRLLAPFALRLLDRNQQRYPLAFARVLCVSQAIRTALLAHTAIPPEQVQVVYNGIALDDFPFQARQRRRGQPLRLLYAGSLVPHKGVHCAVDAMSHLARQGALEGLSLTIVGSGRPDYEARLRAAIAEGGLDQQVILVGRVPRSAMPAQLACHDVLVFPSQWPEPLARMTQEAMASGAVVIGTTTGGTGEILVEGETGLVFAPGDAGQLAERILQLRDDPALFGRLAGNARKRVENQFDFRLMLDRTEAHLLAAIAAHAPAQPNQPVFSR